MTYNPTKPFTSFPAWCWGFAVMLAAGLLAATAHAAPINYGDFSDIPPGSVMYLDVTESASSPGDIEPLFGGPSILVNSLQFTPDSSRLAATTTSPSIPDLTQGSLTFVLEGTGAAITSFALSASGHLTLAGPVGVGASAEVVYGIGVSSISVLEIDGLPVSSPLVLPGSDVSLTADLADGAHDNAPWTMTHIYDVNAALTNAGVSFQTGATLLAIGLSNTLVAQVDTVGEASVSESSFNIMATTRAVPEPATLVLMSLGVLGMATRRRAA